MQQSVSYFLGSFHQTTFGNITKNIEANHLSFSSCQRYNGIFSVHGKASDPVNFLLDILEHFLGIGIFKQFGPDKCTALLGGGVYLFYAFDPLNSLLDSEDDTLFYFLRTGTGIGHPDTYDVEFKRREDLLFDL